MNVISTYKWVFFIFEPQNYKKINQDFKKIRPVYFIFVGNKMAKNTLGKQVIKKYLEKYFFTKNVKLSLTPSHSP